jgi:small GTP-binding protein
MIESDSNQLSLKLIFLGNQNVGKSFILSRFVQDKFEENYNATIGLDYHSKQLIVDKQNIRLVLYDTAGQEKFKSLLKLYIRDSNIVIVVYDITNRESFTNLNYWREEIKELNKDKLIIAIVGNKLDKEGERVVKTQEGEKYASDNNYLFHEISAKSSEGINDFFYIKLEEKIGRVFFQSSDEQNEIINNNAVKELTKRNNMLEDTDNKSKKNRKCC